MRIQKLGHCCLLIEENSLRILTDPGFFTVEQCKEVTDIDVILITHEHNDHIHIDSLKDILKNNPDAKVITISSVAKMLDEAGIAYELMEHGQSATIDGVLIEAFGQIHARFHPTLPDVANTGFFIANQFFYAGDAFTDPGKLVEILALPVAGPWMKIGEAVDYALALKPKVAFPVHDAVYVNPGLGHRVPNIVLPKNGIEFKVIDGQGMVQF